MSVKASFKALAAPAALCLVHLPAPACDNSWEPISMLTFKAAWGNKNRNILLLNDQYNLRELNFLII